MPRGRRTSSLAVLLLLCLTAAAQSINTAVGSAEVLHYDLYYNWKFVWVNAGSAMMSVTQTTYDGLPAYRTRMLTRGSEKADHFFVLRDTLTSLVTSDDMLPREFTKNDVEAGKRRQRRVSYSYGDGRFTADQLYINPEGEQSRTVDTCDEPIYDMLSYILRARSFDPTSWEPDTHITFLMTDGRGVHRETLVYRGPRQAAMRGSSAVYDCLVYSFVQTVDGRERDVATFYVTRDLNRIPVLVEFNLRFGSAKAYLSGYTGLRNPMEARIRQ